MLFNIYIGNHIEEARPLLADIIFPLKTALELCGHLVNIDDNHWAVSPMVTNIFIENFGDDFLAQIIKDKQEYGSAFRFGIVSTEDLLDPQVMQGHKNAQRLNNFLKALEIADFTWTIIANESELGQYSASENIALFELGGSEILRQTRPRPAQHKDIDFLFMGRNQPYREPLFRMLVKYGFSVRLTGGLLPDYYRNSLLERAKVAIDMRRGPEVRFTSPSRLCVGINNGILMVAEEFDQSPLKNWHNFTQNADYYNLIDTAINAVQDDFVGKGEEMRQKLLSQKPISQMAAQALNIPFFKGDK